MGFYNYSLGIAAAVFALAVCLQRLDDLGPKNLVIMALLGLLAITIHLMAFLILALGIGLAVGWRALVEWQSGTPFASTVRATIDCG